MYREWALLIPAYSIVLVMLTYYTYWALALYDTPALDDLKSITRMLTNIRACNTPLIIISLRCFRISSHRDDFYFVWC